MARSRVYISINRETELTWEVSDEALVAVLAVLSVTGAPTKDDDVSDKAIEAALQEAIKARSIRGRRKLEKESQKKEE